MTMKMKINKEEYINKVYGCWTGKNIGGTIGAPYEGKKEMLDVTGFISQKGEPLPNDDLDLQLVWLKAMLEVGPKALNANNLADYWLTYITPHWAEYGINKSNLEMGLLPPLSGEFKNIWKHSNGAWIRSEIWACLAPGVPEVAVKYALMDASIDHGLAEGTNAEIFTAALESIAFFENDIRKIIEKALEFIPENCRIARSVKIVLDSYDKKIPWQEVREMLVKDSEDLGWFQAPANVGYVVLGLMYGEGDFKKSVLYSVNCGDDTDCTAGTCAAILGIILGADKLPSDWKEYIGDRIITMCINGSYSFLMPKTCTELTEIVAETMPNVLYAHDITAEYTDGVSDLENINHNIVLKDYTTPYRDCVKNILTQNPYSFEICEAHTKARIEYDGEPIVKPNSEFNIKISLKNNRRQSFHYEFDVYLPEGWTAEYNRTGYIYERTQLDKGICEWQMKITVGEKVDAINKFPIMIFPKGHVMPIIVPIVLLG